jgi:catechol 2,3-dioxygenase-like lactoylglutathione lyase family enzyme
VTAPRVWYLVRDFDLGRDFYKRVLGFEETFVDWDDKWSRLENGAMRIAIAEGEPTHDGGVATVDVDDVKLAADRLRSEGVEVGTVLELAGQMRLVDVFDPDGNRVQLAQPLDDEPLDDQPVG